MATTKTESAVKTEFKTIKALVVKSVAKEFRRIGLAFTREATHLDPTLLTDDQVTQLKSDANLSVTEARIKVTADDAASPNPVVTPVTTDAADTDAK